MFVSSDLHGHTSFSDGRTTPEAYVDFRRELGMRLIAVADHDVMAGVRRAAVRAQAAGMILLPALEVTSFFHYGTSRAEQVHVLAYYPQHYLQGPRLEQTALYKRGLRVQEAWKAFVLDWLAGLPADDREALDPGSGLEKLPAAEFPALQPTIDLITARRRELFPAFRDHHVKFWEDGRELFGWEPEEAISLIRSDGAVDVVAHPARYRDKDRAEKLLHAASGVEVYTSRHKGEVAARYRAFAESKRKHWTASSDDHQNARYQKPPVGTPLFTAERLLRRPLPLEMIVSQPTG